MIGGLDGCRAGWVLVTGPAEDNGATAVVVVPDITPVIAMIDEGELAAVGIDIPIGLPERGSRRCDIEARRLIGARRSSVFPAPARAVLGSPTYEEANRRSREVSGRGISRQAFNITPKIQEVDLVMTNERQQVLVEAHPEASLAALAGRPMAHHKASPEGRAERLAVLRTTFRHVDDHVAGRRPGARPDDVLDAFATAWSARRWLAGTHRQLGGDVDRRGLRMEIIV